MADVKQHPVFLGMPDTEIHYRDDIMCSWDTNKIGGRPNWMQSPPDVYPTCVVCSRILYLIAQIYCPLYNAEHHRTLYMFGCANPLCWNKSKSWLVLRCQSTVSYNEKNQEITVTKASEKHSSVDDWCEDAADWGDQHSNDPIMEELESLASKMTLTSEEKRTQKVKVSMTNDALSSQHYDAPCFTSYYINVFEDTNKQTGTQSLTAHEKDLLALYQEKEGKDLKDILTLNTGQVMENYEKTSVAHGDYGFRKFLKYLHSCPQQCIRYQWSGTPLSISDAKPSDVPPCQYCGANRVCELQLMPALVQLLKVKDIPSPSNNVTAPHKDTCNDSSLDTGNYGDETTAKRNSCDNSGALGHVNNPCIAESIDTNIKQLRDSISHAKQHTIEFGTVMVFSCAQSCWHDNDRFYREEYVVVQADSDDERLNLV